MKTTQTGDRERLMAETIRVAIERVARIPDRRPQPDTTTHHGVLAALRRYIECVIDDAHWGIEHEEWAQLAKTATYLDQLESAYDYATEVGIPGVPQVEATK